MAILPFGGVQPQVDPTAFIAPDAWIVGKVTVGAETSVFFNVVIRGDIQPITIGSKSNLQEHVLVHTSHGLSPVTIGDQVTVGHRAIIHGCTIERCALIGMGATILDDARIGEYSLAALKAGTHACD
jgi:carbonic anhydrase/acetyltransferase-like protein (isoleucine patch superfamily)